MPDDLLTTAEVAEAFRVGVHAVTGWVRSGRLAAIRTPGGRIRIRRSDVEAFLGVAPDIAPHAPAPAEAAS